MSNGPLKRFIAGAVCPNCQLIDKLVVYREDDHEFCLCVRCGHKQQQELEAKPVVAKLGKKEQIIRVIRPRDQMSHPVADSTSK